MSSQAGARARRDSRTGGAHTSRGQAGTHGFSTFRLLGRINVREEELDSTLALSRLGGRSGKGLIIVRDRDRALGAYTPPRPGSYGVGTRARSTPFSTFSNITCKRGNANPREQNHCRSAAIPIRKQRCCAAPRGRTTSRHVDKAPTGWRTPTRKRATTTDRTRGGARQRRRRNRCNVRRVRTRLGRQNATARCPEGGASVPRLAGGSHIWIAHARPLH